MLTTASFDNCRYHNIPFPKGSVCPKCTPDINDQIDTPGKIPCTCETEGHCFLCNMALEQDLRMLNKISDGINETMAKYHSSLEPTDDEVAICWLISYIDRLHSKQERIWIKYNTLVDKLIKLAEKSERAD